jgi:transposase-like protein
VNPGSFRVRRLTRTYTRKCDGRIVPNFVCRACKHGFSQQTFAASYYLKRPELTTPIAHGIVNGAAHRQVARMVGCAHSTVTKRVRRLGRHAQLLQQLLLNGLPRIDEPINYDDFEIYTGSQYFPSGVGTSIGHHSWFSYTLGYAPHRRSGTLSPAQRVKRARLEERCGKPPRGSYVTSLLKQLDILGRKLTGLQPTVISDDMKAYAIALRRHPCGNRISHLVYPNPKRGSKGSPRTREARQRDRAMHPIDALHGFTRHSLKGHARETISLGRRVEAQLERLYLFAIFRNLVKRRSERTPVRKTPAMWLGLTTEIWTWERVFAMRLQPSRIENGPAWPELYRRSMRTPMLPGAPPHALKLAY